MIFPSLSRSAVPAFVSFVSFAAVLFLAGTAGARADDGTAPRRVANVALNDILIVAEQKGWLKEEFDPLGADVKLVPSTPQVVPALFERKSLDIANSMIGISVFQLINGFDPVIVWESSRVSPRFITIVVPKDSPVKTLADLKGKTLGVAQWTCPHYAAYEALQNAGLALDSSPGTGDVRLVNTGDGGMAPTAMLLSGRIDALAGLALGVSSLYVQGAVRDIGTALPDGWYTRDERVVFYARREWARDNADLIRGLLRAQERSVAWIQAHPDEAAQIVFDKLRTPKEVSAFQFREPGNNRLVLPERDWTVAEAAFRGFQQSALANFAFLRGKASLSDAQIDRLYDKRFFHGGAYAVDGGPAPAAQGAQTAAAPSPALAGN